MTSLRQPFRVVEVGQHARVAGWLLTEFGATVVQVIEQPGPQVPHRFLDRGKRRLRVNPNDAETAPLVNRLVSWASVMVLSKAEGPSELTDLLLATARERAVPRVVITPSGSGPGVIRPVTDLTAWAASGLLSVMGYPHRPPTVPGGRQSLFVVGANAGIAALALATTDPTARPLEVEVRVQECLVGVAAEKGVPSYLDDGLPRTRTGESGQYPARGLFPARDGLVAIVTFSDVQWDGLARWMASLGAEPLLRPGDFAGNPQGRYELAPLIDAWITRTTAEHSVAELVITGQRFGVPITPVHTFRQFVEHPLFTMRAAIATAADGRRTLRSPFRLTDLRQALCEPGDSLPDLWGPAEPRAPEDTGQTG
jgi:CoA:oxalate CoA-transferase